MSPVIATQHGHDTDVVDLARGDPGRDLLPAALVRDAAARATAGLDPDLLQYGLEPGDAGARAAIAAFLEREAAGTSAPERLFVTAGASVALHLACALFAQPGDRVLVADPTYHLALAQFRDHGLRVEGVASDGDGIVPAALEEALRRGPAALLYLVPAYANPSGTTLPTERQRAVVDLTAGYGVRVLADEVYRLTGFLQASEADTGGASGNADAGGRRADAAAQAARPPRSLAALDGEFVLSLNSVSKILSPGLRLGWIEGPPADLERIATSGVLRSGGGMNPFTAAVVRAAIEAGALATHLATVRERLRERHAALAAALAAEAPQASFAPAAGGYFLWLRVPGLDVTDPAWRETLRRHAVRVAPGPQFSPATGAQAAGAAREHLRVCFAHATPSALREGVARLAAALADVGC